MGCAQGKAKTNKKPTQQQAKKSQQTMNHNNIENSGVKPNNTINQSNVTQQLKKDESNIKQPLQEIKQNQSHINQNSDIDQENKSNTMNKSGLKQNTMNKSNIKEEEVNKSGLKENSNKSGLKQEVASPMNNLNMYEYNNITQSKPQFGTFKKNQTVNQTAQDDIVHEENDANFDLGINFNMQIQVQ